METIQRLLEIVGEQSFFLLGPRGTGKSTLIKNLYKEAVYVDLLLPDVLRAYLAKPERLRELVYANSGKKTFVLDEIQKATELLPVVHSLIEEKKGWQFVLTGSSARKLKKTGVNLLAGRALVKHLHPFLASELGNKFVLDAALKTGLIPLIVASGNPEETLKAYIELYIREEVQIEGLTRNIGNFSRFLETISFSHGSVLNVSNIARECQIERKVVEGYINILEDILLAFRLPVFSKRAKRALSSHPKFYYFDAGIYRMLRPSGPIDRKEETSGLALEGLVAQHLRAWIDYRNKECKLYFWRTSSGNEVDFVIYGGDIFWAIEVKNSTNIHPKDLSGLQSFGEEYPEAKKILLYRGQEKLLRNGISIEPCEGFLRQLNPTH
ncbi:ATPase [candidate division WOR-1 bacterium RIFOXYA12_FULL_43_27]|uniref:ATPase n=1 Tax=candidate division WOR-1 bacterium RIFOXYC2_FULL_46_14 TaxID=1802587 RepID=A0A1F4U638_UNCSA|nr:MAG: ATPase [candidate division WOR-1 bacterium RIFOXYA12_FULL_43_27]OGC20503.1 MAG: ATPase [candidate division WOR-1 bacterium RIFOXYB2_FULL_46_45]OGC31760.1 MAG: ATPase [candidate division WOR-1 bacterium RIFOXYA2_FULL_46_56]OGC40347.1 MAG: ATPase [candidate division WOR-1 bacterium RIFOXYC2_FULL_46_14]